jgi:hypothetical protein
MSRESTKRTHCSNFQNTNLPQRAEEVTCSATTSLSRPGLPSLQSVKMDSWEAIRTSVQINVFLVVYLRIIVSRRVDLI